MNAPASEVLCRTCAYWVQDGRRRPFSSSDLGGCRRNPPQIVLTPNGARGLWPVTNADDFCGEHAVAS